QRISKVNFVVQWQRLRGQCLRASQPGGVTAGHATVEGYAAVGRSALPVGRQRAFKQLLRFRKPPTISVQLAQEQQRIRLLRRLCKCCAADCFGLVCATLNTERGGKSELRWYVVFFQFEGSAKAARGLIYPPAFELAIAEIAMTVGALRIDAQGLLVGCQRLLPVAVLA